MPTPVSPSRPSRRPLALLAVVAVLVSSLVGARLAPSRPVGASLNPVGAALWSVTDISSPSASVVVAIGVESGDDPSRQGLVISTDGGATWTHRSLPGGPDGSGGTIMPHRVAFTSATDGVVASIAHPSMLLHTTSDGGQTWTAAPLGAAGQPEDIARPSAGTVLVTGAGILAGDGSFTEGVRRSTDGGATWSWASLPPGGRLSQMAFSSPTVGWATGSHEPTPGFPQGAVFGTTDGGATWSVAGPAEGRSGPIAVGPGGRIAALPERGFFDVPSLVVSTDGGSTWATRTVDLPYMGVEAVAWAEDGTLVVGGTTLACPEMLPLLYTPDSVVVTSSDGGLTWTRRAPAPNAALGFTRMLASGSSLWAATHHTTGHPGIQRSTDAGASWDAVWAPGLPPGPFTGVRAWSETQATATSPSGFVHTDDAGATWEAHLGPESSGSGPDGMVTPDLIQGPCRRSTDGGATWSVLPPEQQSVVPPLMLTPTEGFRIDIVAGVLDRTTDGGVTWTPGTPLWYQALDIVSPTTLVAATGDGDGSVTVQISTDRASTWTDRTFSSPGGQVVAIDFLSATEGWVLTRQDFPPSPDPLPRLHLHRTTDGGLTWTSVAPPAGLVGLSMPSLEALAPGQLVISHFTTTWSSGDDGWYQPATVAVTTDGGATWSQNLLPVDPDEILWGFSVDAVTPSVLWMSSERRIARSTDGGATWTTVMGRDTSGPSPEADAPWPGGLSVEVGDGEATVRWTSPPFSPVNPVTGYRVGIATDWDVEYVEGPASATSITVPLHNENTYRLFVQARTEAGWGVESPLLGPITPVAVPPAAPVGVTATAGDGFIDVTWEAGTGGGLVEDYRVEIDPPSTAGWGAEQTVAGDQRSVRLDGLTNGTAYRVRVVATRFLVGEAASAWTDWVTPEAVVTVDPPSAPRNVQAFGRPGSVAVSWQAPSGGDPVQLYTVTVTPAGGGDPVVRTAGATTLSTTVTGLANGRAHTVAVTAMNPGGTGPAATVAGVVPVPFASTGALVDQIARDMTTRTLPASERTLWIGRIDAHTHGPADLLAHLRTTTDAITYVDKASRMYFAYFLRMPDKPGLDYWVDRARNGEVPARMSAKFAASKEFQQRYGSLTNRQFVELIYTNVLKRPAEPAGLQFWTAELNGGKRSRGWVMAGFSESAEYRRDQAAEVDVAVLYLNLVGREPALDFFDDRVAALEAESLSRRDVAAEILALPEYSARF